MGAVVPLKSSKAVPAGRMLPIKDSSPMTLPTSKFLQHRTTERHADSVNVWEQKAPVLVYMVLCELQLCV